MPTKYNPSNFNNELEYVEAELGFNLDKTDYRFYYELNEEGKFLVLVIKDRSGININFIENLTSLIVLDLSKNQIQDIQALSKLTSLTLLYLSNNQIQDISALSKLTSLTSLYLSNNQIQDISALSKLTSLTLLYLSNNQIQDISALSKLTSLTEMNLSNNQVQDISTLSKLTSLTEMNLSNNQVQDIGVLSKLTPLTELYLSNNQIQYIGVLSKLTSLTELHLSDNQIQDIGVLSSLTSLTELHLSDNQIQDIGVLSSLTSLTELHLSDNQIQDIQAFSNLTSLIFLHLSNNQIQDIQALSKLTLLKGISLYDNPIENVPKTVLNSSPQEIIRWLQENEKKEEKVLLKDVKILLLGNTNIGKSNLLFLWQQRYRKISKRKRYPKKSITTHGLVYKEMQKTKKAPLLHIWDFGGQEYFHATHQLFFSPDALHVLLWSKNMTDTRVVGEEVFELDYWLRCSEQLSKGDSPIEMVMVENRIDHEDEKNDLEFYTHFPEKKYLEKFNIYSPHKENDTNKPPFMLNACSVSLRHKKRLEGMFELLEERVEMLYQKNEYPSIYAEIRNTLAESDKAVWTLSEYKKKFKEKDGVILQTLHSAGCLLYFHKQLPNKIFTAPNVLLDLIYDKILNTNLKKNKGRLITELKDAADTNKLGLKKKDLENLLSAFKLIFQTKDGSWYAPQYLPEASPAWLQLLKEYTFGEANVIVFSDHYLMNSILLDIFTEYADVIEKDASYLFWQKGLVIRKNDQLLLVEYDRKLMRLRLYGDQLEKNQQLQTEVVDFIIKIIHKDDEPLYELDPKKENLDRTSFKNFIPKSRGWNSDKVKIGVSVDGKYYVNVQQLNDNVANEIYTIKGFNYDDSSIQKTLSVFEFNQYLDNQHKGKMKKVAISYSKDDLVLVNEFIKNLVPLQDDGLIAAPVWYCTDLEAGSEWDKTIQENFEAADIIFFMVSPSFLATNYIKEYEIKTAIRKYNKQKEDNVPLTERIRIIPIRLEYCSWIRKEASINLGQFSALPYKAKPVTDYHNRHQAWYLVTENIRMAIENERDPNFKFKTNKEIQDLQERQVEGKLDNNSD